MYNKKNKVTINVTINYEYESQLEKIKEIIKQITDIKDLEKLEVNIED